MEDEVIIDFNTLIRTKKEYMDVSDLKKDLIPKRKTINKPELKNVIYIKRFNTAV